MILPYYKIDRTEEGKQFFFSHYGYFNFWDEYLILNIKEGHNEIFSVLVNRTGRTFSNPQPTKYYNIIKYLYITCSVRQRKPEEMFKDFPELK